MPIAEPFCLQTRQVRCKVVREFSPKPRKLHKRKRKPPGVPQTYLGLGALPIPLYGSGFPTLLAGRLGALGFETEALALPSSLQSDAPSDLPFLITPSLACHSEMEQKGPSRERITAGLGFVFHQSQHLKAICQSQRDRKSLERQETLEDGNTSRSAAAVFPDERLGLYGRLG